MILKRDAFDIFPQLYTKIKEHTETLFSINQRKILTFGRKLLFNLNSINLKIKL